MKKLFIILISINLIACKTTKLDHKTGDINPTWNTVQLNKVHKTAWHAGNDIITPSGLKPVTVKTNKNEIRK